MAGPVITGAGVGATVNSSPPTSEFVFVSAVGSECEFPKLFESKTVSSVGSGDGEASMLISGEGVGSATVWAAL